MCLGIEREGGRMRKGLKADLWVSYLTWAFAPCQEASKSARYTCHCPPNLLLASTQSSGLFKLLNHWIKMNAFFYKVDQSHKVEHTWLCLLANLLLAQCEPHDRHSITTCRLMKLLMILEWRRRKLDLFSILRVWHS